MGGTNESNSNKWECKKRWKYKHFTKTILEELEKENIEMEIISFAGKVINTCKSCFTCGGKNLGSPVYSTNISSTMQAFLERASVVADMNPKLLTHKLGCQLLL